MNSKKYRNLTTTEVALLEKQGCSSTNWSKVEVSDGFEAEYIQNVIFRRHIKIGATGTEIINDDGIRRRTGIYNSEIIDCTIGDNVFISRIGAYISGYDIADDVYIEDTGNIVCTGKSTFGNGIMAATLNEGGGREVPIHDNMTAQTGYMMTMYRHRPEMIRRMEQMVGEYVKTLDPARGVIGRGAKIISCNTIRDMRIGDHAVIFGVSELTDGTIKSSKETPTHIGTGTKAHDFICSYGSRIDNGSVLSRCFVGEACHVDFGFVAADSLFFANAHCANGEAASIFAGPYTVSHHRATLLIAGYFSFFNAGSGSNQSNHLFRTGAIHQGIHERGAKFGSSSYIMLPAREGAYTVVLGKHRSHHDTTDFPYSYLLEEDGHSFLIPAANLINHGMLRDIAKWPKRDKRGDIKSDLINFREFTPYIGNKIGRAIMHSERMLERADVNIFNFERARIKRSVLRRGVKIYQQALDATIGTILAEGFGSKVAGDPDWVDMAGMYAPRREVVRILDRIENGELSTIEAIDRELISLHGAYRDHAYGWALMRLGETLEREPSSQDIADAVAKGLAALEEITTLRTHNARQDAGEIMATGYGIDAVSHEEIAADFRAVRGVEI